MADLATLRTELLGLSPVHDTPLGTAHPYWARKPLNLVDTIIRSLTDEDDVVIDPFMGSGTTVFAALRARREAVGGDISPLSHFIVAATLDLIANGDILIPELRRILDEHRAATLPWYLAENGRYVERVRYDVDGDFAHGAFGLRAVEIVTADVEGRAWRRRRIDDIRWEPEAAALAPHLNAPIDFDTYVLPENSRIAIPAGARLAHYFTRENRASINLYRELVARSPLAAEHQAALEFPLSSALPQLRLSDRKSSSQWPYWRPRAALTSRNPIRVLEERLARTEAMVEWARAAGVASAGSAPRAKLHLAAAQDLDSVNVGEAALVLTDPPYGDQVPYGEYAELWNGVLDLAPPATAAGAELVRSNAQHRRADSSAYLDRLGAAFTANAALVRPGGHLVWFYQDQDLRCWQAIAAAADTAGVVPVDVVAIPKQRRSLKTVISPGTTLDGDLVCIFRRPAAEGVAPPRRASVSGVGGESDTDYFGRYAKMIADALMTGSIADLADQFGTVKKALAIRE